ncbi:MAG: hypothetical protein V4555_03180 [Acidobacteriota bacterium]
MARSLARKDPGAWARVLLAASMAGMSYLSFFNYKAQGLGAAGAWSDLLAGRGAAPEQYRVGVVWLAHALMVHLHGPLPAVLAAIDGVCGVVAVMVLMSVLERSEVYAQASVALKWLGAVTMLWLVEWFLAWLLWIGKPETMPAAMLVALILGLWSVRGREALVAVGLAVATLALATFRADVACLLNAGVFAFMLLRPEARFSLSRKWALSGSGLIAVLAAGVQWWLMRVKYPQARYGNVKLWQLWPNVHHASRWPPFVVFLLPVAWMVFEVVRRRFVRDAASVALLVGAGLFAMLWVTIGKIDEVRIFLPMALALAPLTAEMVMLRAGEAAQD